MNDRIKAEIEGFKNFLELSETELDAAKFAWTIIEPQFPQLLEQFYDHLLSTESAQFFVGKDLSVIKAAQTNYWRALFAGKFEPAYQTHVNIIWEKHRAVGVEMTQYIGAYAWFSEHFFQIIARSTPPEPYQRHVMLRALNKVIYLDMMIASSASNAHWIDA